MKKILELTYGKPDADAYAFMELAREDVTQNGGFFQIEVDEGERFKNALYLSSIMLDYANFFLDIIIIDSTYKKIGLICL